MRRISTRKTYHRCKAGSRRGAAWVILVRIVGIGITMLVNIVLARWLSPEDFGDFLLLCNVMSLASMLAMMGLNAALVRFISESLGQGDVRLLGSACGSSSPWQW